MRLLAVAVAVAVGVFLLGQVYLARLEQVRKQRTEVVICTLGPYGSDPVDQRCPRY